MMRRGGVAPVLSEMAALTRGLVAPFLPVLALRARAEEPAPFLDRGGVRLQL